MVDVICDTSFLIHLATRKIKNLDSIYTEIGNIEFVIPLVVLNELEQLTKRPKKQDDASKTLEFVRDMKNIKIVEATTEAGFKRNSFIYDFLSSMRQKINDPLGQRAKKREEISQR